MKAIVLTYDRNTILTEHMIKCYEELWPNHPLTFRIPFQDEKRCVFAPRREYIRSSPEIRATVLTLLENLDEEEWIYWCIDDKYPIKLNLFRILSIYQSIKDNEVTDNCGVLFCRAGRLLDPEYLTNEKVLFGEEILLERKGYHKIWIHQFLRVKVIRHLFMNFPDYIEVAKTMDKLKFTVKKPITHRIYVTSVNHSVFGESSFGGVITQSCLKSLIENGFNIPNWQPPTPEREKIIGII